MERSAAVDVTFVDTVAWLGALERTMTRASAAKCLVVSALLVVLGATRARGVDLLVTNLADEVTAGNGCSLREAMANADADAQIYPDCAAGLGPDTIRFAQSGTITLTLGALPTITRVAGLVIDGGPELVTISGGGLYRHFVVEPTETLDAGYDLTLRHLVLTAGKAPNGASAFDRSGGPGHVGGSIVNRANLLLREVRITGARAGNGGGSPFAPGIGGDGGAIANLGPAASLAAVAVLFDDNQAGQGGQHPQTSQVQADAGSGGAIYNGGGVVTLVNTTFFGNVAPLSAGADGMGGAIDNEGGLVIVLFSTFRHNSAYYGPGVYSAGETTFFATVMANDALTPDCDAAPGGFLVNVGYNLEGRASCGFTGNHSLQNQDNSSVTPPINNLKLGPLLDNGGLLPSIALGSGSRAIDYVPFIVAGYPNFTNCAKLNTLGPLLEEPLMIDGRSRSRPSRAGEACDAGAFEFRSGLGSPGPRPDPEVPTLGRYGLLVLTLLLAMALVLRLRRH
jgi:hypothetical protein